MQDTLTCIAVVLCWLTVRHAKAETSFHQIRATDALLSSSHKDAFSSHLQRMLQMDSDPFNSLDDGAGLQDCSPVALTVKSNCDARRRPTGNKTTKMDSFSGHNSTSDVTTCSGPGCTIAATPGSYESSSLKGIGEDKQQHDKLVVYGPMTQDAFERMAQRKRSSLSAERKEKGAHPKDEHSIPFPAAPEVILKDEHGIPFPAEVAPKDKSRGDFEMRFAPQSPAPQSVVQPKAYAESPDRQPDIVPRAYAESPAPQPAVASRPCAESPAPQTNVKFRTYAESPAPAPAVTATEKLNGVNPNSTSQQQEQVKSETPCGPGKPPMTEEEAARLAVHVAAVEVGLARKRELAHAHIGTESAGKTGSALVKARGGTLPSTSKHSSSSAAWMASPQTSASTSPSIQDRNQPRHRRNDVERTLLMEGAGVQADQKQHLQPAAPQRSMARASRIRRNWSLMGGVFAMIFVFCVFSILVLLVASMVEGALQAEPGHTNFGLTLGLPLPQQWFALTRALWRRGRRAYLAACKGLTQHQHLPIAARKDAGALAVFLRLFWNHLTDLKTAGQRAVKRMSCGGSGSRHSSIGGASISSGGAYAASLASYGGASHASCGGAYTESLASSYAASRASFGGASHVSYGDSRRGSYAGAHGYGTETSVWSVTSGSACPQAHAAFAAMQDASEPCVIQADDSATVTALAELQLRRRHYVDSVSLL